MVVYFTYDRWTHPLFVVAFLGGVVAASAVYLIARAVFGQRHVAFVYWTITLSLFAIVGLLTPISGRLVPRLLRDRVRARRSQAAIAAP